jgi:phage shock protein PspC (stress-responsive transcriptional regulator)
MKKIININLSGRVIPIEDSAYEKLQAYIESLRRYFSKEESRDEIINDIESRIAELMSEKVRKGASSITDGDVDEIAASMGRPEDFDAEDATDSTSSAHSGPQQETFTHTEKKRRGRLYRDTSDKFIGGVCSGIAAYLNVDPAIVRILFAIVTFGGFGLGFVAYILLWMILPPKDLEGFSGKRLYRNPDDKIIGGVAGGLAAYFGRSVSTVRLIFAAPILLSVLLSILDGWGWDNSFDLFPNIVFGSISGTFFLAYVILWMVLPEARSPYEKMEMRGEKVDVNSIRQNVKEGAESMKDRVHGWSEEVKESAKNFSNKARDFASTRGKAFATEVNETARSGGRGLAHAIGVIFKVFFFFIAGTIAFALFVALMALIFGGMAWWPINNFLWTSNWQQMFAWGTLIFFFAVPLIAFITWVIRRILRSRSQRNYLGWTFGFLWTIGWVSATLLAVSLTKDHREHEHIDNEIAIIQPPRGKMIVTVKSPELTYTGRFDWVNDGDEGWDLTVDTMKLSTVDFNFEKSADDNYHVILKRYSFGSTREEAIERADKIQYSIFSSDSTLDLANGYSIDKQSKFRWQYVEVEIQIPEGKAIRFDETVNRKLNPGSFGPRKRRNSDRERWGFDENYYFRSLRSNIDYIMGADSRLRDASGLPAGAHRTDYRYDGGTDTMGLRLELENEKRKREESDRRIRDLENQQKEEKKPTSEVFDKSVKPDDIMGSSPTIIPLFAWIY